MRVLRFVPIAVAVFSFTSPAHADSERQRTHLELTWGFLGGERSYAHQSFAFSEGGASPALEAPFVGEPFDGVPVAGMGFEVRWVSNGVRAGVGAEYPFPKIKPDIMFTVYADVIGTAYTADAKVVLGDEQSKYTTSGFGFSGRSGGRVMINKHYFAYAHAKAGITEHVIWAGHAGLGFHIP